MYGNRTLSLGVQSIVIRTIATGVLFLSALGLAAPGQSRSVFLNPAKPGAYVTFERIGKRIPERANETEQGIFLKIHNNTHWILIFDALDDGPSENGDASLMYDVIEDPRGYPTLPLPAGNWFDVVNSVWLRPSKSLLFSVPMAKLGVGLGLSIRFNYEWDANRIGEPRHTLVFYHSELPENLRRGEKRRPGFMEGVVEAPEHLPLPPYLPGPALSPPPVGPPPDSH